MLLVVGVVVVDDVVFVWVVDILLVLLEAMAVVVPIGVGFVGCGKGPRLRRRMACVMVGWKRPPWGEWAVRCVGRTWPREKKVERRLWPLLAIVVSTAVEGMNGSQGWNLLVLEADVVAAETPAQVIGIEGVAQWQDAPY